MTHAPVTQGDVQPSPLRVFTVLLTSLGGLLFGYGTGVIAGALPLVSHTYGLSSWSQGAAVSAALLGAALTAPTSGRLADRLGRRPVLGGATAFYAAGTLLSATAEGTAALLAGRLLVGLALGATSFAVPLYISEIAPPARRGALVTLNQLMITVGLLLSYVVAYVLEPSGNWRTMFALGAAPALILLAGLPFVPESPEWLHSRGRTERAAREAHRLGLPASAADSTPSATRGLSLRAAAAHAGPRWVALGLAIAVLVHLTGLNTAIYYAPTILASSGLTSSGGVAGSVLVGSCNVLATVFTIVFLDRWGRRPLMLGGLAVMAAAAVAIAGVQSLGDPGVATAVLLCLFITAGAVGPAAVFWVYIAEIYPARARGALMSLATAAHWAADFVVATTFLPLVQGLSLEGAFLVYAVITAASAVGLGRWMQETKSAPVSASVSQAPAATPPTLPLETER
ncbi:sugar porter family MFS transporter [Streptomyces hiroshimensis]|uniref:MFS transporter n=1 Tax=Streptomyces hiroshimensis TaxID=66424 RepID=A0ABQ2ZB60_9ACTN|nr:sugar porter family MFS transporter [Streptomyces hiroshimensis]GGY07011.1 MFS transporter [Streptomyces hiroshimensis]